MLQAAQTLPSSTLKSTTIPAKALVRRKLAKSKLDEASLAARAATTDDAKRKDTIRLAGLLNTTSTQNAMVITPTMAEVMLETNTGNRNVGDQKVNEYASVMKRGGWRLTGETIVFSKEGILNNGQHRLLACIRAEVSFVTDVRFGVERDTFDCVDIGQKRTAGQILSMGGEKNANVLGAALRLLICYKQKNFRFDTKGIQPAMLSEALDKTPKLRESVTKAVSAFHEFKLLPQSGLAFCHYLLAKIDQAEADKFLFDIGSGEGMKKYDPVMALRQFAINNPVQGRAASVFWIPLIMRAWNARRAGIDIKSMRTPTEATYSEHFPHPA